MDNDKVEKVRLINLVVARLQEEFPNYIIESVYRNVPGPEHNYYDLYVCGTNIGEVDNTEISMWLPPCDGYKQKAAIITYHAADPKFFIHIVGTVKLILYRYKELGSNYVFRISPPS